MACVAGKCCFVCTNAAVTFPSHSELISTSRPGFCTCNQRESKIQDLIKHQFQTTLVRQVDTDRLPVCSSRRRHLGRATYCAGLRKYALDTSWFWLAPQNVGDNRLKQISTERLVSCKVYGTSPSLSSDNGQQEHDIDRGGLAQFAHEAAGTVPSVSAERWLNDEERIQSNDGTKVLNSSAQGNELTTDRFVNIVDGQSEAAFDAQAVKDLDATLPLQPVDPSSHYAKVPAILGLEGDNLPSERGNLLQVADIQVVNKTDGKLQESPVSSSSVGEPGKKFECTGAAADVLELIEGARPLTVIDLSDSKSEFANLDSRTRKHGDRDETQTTIGSTGFWKIVNNDIEFLEQSFNWAKEVAFPWLAEHVENVVWLRLWEDASLVSASDSSHAKTTYSELPAQELLAADSKSLKGYTNIAKNWFKTWRIPLEPVYQPELIADYFNRRPHVVLFRILQVSTVFGSVLIQCEIEKALNGSQRSAMQTVGNNIQESNRWPELLKGALVKLGPTFIKVGQSLSTRPDLVGSETAKILAELQDNLAPFPTSQAISIIEREFGQPLNEIFSHISKNPVAAASFGQVYKARTSNGQEVAVKVQRPKLLCSVALDIYILRIALAAIRRIAKRRNDLRLYADELGQGFFGELDYIQEASNAAHFQEAHSMLSFLEVPKVITSLSTRSVLTMEWVDGDRPVDLLLMASGQDPNGHAYLREEQLKAKQRLFSMVTKGVEASLVQLLDTGIVHADPHPGNLLYTKNDQMVLLDFGLLCRMEKKHQLAMIACVAHIVNAEWKNFVDDLADMEVLPRDINRIAIALEMEDALVDAVPKAGVPDIKFSKVLVKVLAIALKHQFKMPPYFILVLRSIASLEGLALAVDPNFKVFAASYPFVLQRLLTDKSPRLRKVFIPLILNERKEFRWDRLASFATLARQYSMQRAALEKGMEIQNASASGEHSANYTTPVLVPLLVNLLVSRDGAILRRLILEADTFALARTFNSRKAAVFRRNVATAMADAVYQSEPKAPSKQTEILLQNSLESPQSLPSLPEENLQKTISISETSLPNKEKLVSASPSSMDGSLLKSRRFQFLLRTLVARLRKTPLLLLNTGWTCFSMFCYAIFLAAQRLIVALAHRCLPSSPAKKQRIDNQLILATA